MASSASPTTQVEENSSPAINVADFISTKLCGNRSWNNYLSWKAEMLCLVESQGLVGFIDGTNHPPSDDVGELRRTDWLVKGWILGTLSDEVFHYVVNLDSAARDVWLELENYFCIRQDTEIQLAQGGSGHDVPDFVSSKLRGDRNENNYISGQPPAAPPPPEWGPTVDVANFVPSKLSRRSDWRSYKLWKEGMLRLVQSQGLAGFFDTGAYPPQGDNAGYNWRMQNDGKVKGWILEALSDEVAENAAHLDYAKDVWLELENKFFSSKPSRQQEKESLEELEFYNVAMNGDWNRAKVILKHNPDIIRLRMFYAEETALHVVAY